MQTIPNEVKTLFKADSVFKNFHVRFPNGETSDLNNDSIEFESVRFTESLCSQKVLRFGLTEAPQIEFIAIGIPNVRGAVIQCAIEIDVSTLGTSWASDHQPSGSEGFLEPQLVTLPSGSTGYRIPVGEFVIDECKRNHEAIAKRSITAFGNPLSRNADFSKFEQWRMSVPIPTKSTSFNVYDFICTSLGVVLSGYSRTAIQTPSTSVFALQTKTMTDGTNTYTLAIKPDVVYSYTNLGATVANLYELDITKADYDIAVNEITAEMDRIGIIGWTSDNPQPTRKMLLNNESMSRWIGASYGFRYSGAYGYSHYCFGESTLFSRRDTQDNTDTLTICEQITVSIYSGTSTSGTPLWSKTYTMVTNPQLYRYNITPGVALRNIRVSFGNTGKVTSNTYGTQYTYIDAYEMSKILSGFLELQAKFGKRARDGSLNICRLSDGATETIQRSQYSSVWLEDDDVSEIGTIRFGYKWNKGTKVIEYQFANGESIYDMTDNYILENITGVSDETLINILESQFIPYISDVGFTPAEIEMHGLPYVETGDYITCVLEDGTTATTMVLERTLSGVQMLMDTITSNGGEVFERSEYA